LNRLILKIERGGRKIREIKIDDVQFIKDVYPRRDYNRETVNKYRMNVDNLPPIDVTKDGLILVDGYHRIIAHRLEKRDVINANLLDINKENILWEATKRNSRHGQQLETSEKSKLAKIFYNNGHNKLDEIAVTLAVSKRSIEKWTRELRDKEDDERNQQILELYLQCKTQQEIADEIHNDQGLISKILKNMQNRIFTEIHNSPPDSLQIENLWNFSRCDNRYGTPKYPGRMPGQIVENLLWYYTEPFDIVVDPMVGGGTTIDVCKEMYRRCIAYDIKPLNHKIQKNNILKGIPAKKKAKLIILDPPYSFQKKGEYTDNPDDLSNMNLPKFSESIETIVKYCKSVLEKNGYIAFIISSLRKKGNTYDLPFLCYQKFLKQKYNLLERIIVPYQGATSDTGFWAKDAREKKYILRKYRDLMIFQWRNNDI